MLASRKNSVDRMLSQELQYFKKILTETEEFYNHLDLDSAEELMDMLNSRERWIREIKKSNKMSRETNGGSLFQKRIKEEISAIAKTLVAVDAKIYDILQRKKLEKVKELSKISDIRNRNHKIMNPKVQPTARFIDIKQE